MAAGLFRKPRPKPPEPKGGHEGRGSDCDVVTEGSVTVEESFVEPVDVTGVLLDGRGIGGLGGRPTLPRPGLKVRFDPAGRTEKLRDETVMLTAGYALRTTLVTMPKVPVGQRC